MGELSPPLISLQDYVHQDVKCVLKKVLNKFMTMKIHFVYLTSSGNVVFDCRRGRRRNAHRKYKRKQNLSNNSSRRKYLRELKKANQSPQPIIIPSPTSVVKYFLLPRKLKTEEL